MLVIPNQRRGVLDRYGLSRDEADRSAWAVDRQGRRWEGAAAINRAMREVGGTPSRLAAPYALGWVAALEDALYGWFAPRRSRFSMFGVRPECEEPGSGCA